MRFIASCFVLLFFSILSSMILVPKTYAIEDPFSKPNNFIGIHILFPSELDSAQQLINSNGGDWGYVTIPLQLNDLDLTKWQQFMNQAGRDHVIPIIRLATEDYWQNTQTWAIPTQDNITDEANFLNSLNWPTKNRYVILFNEENRYDEWGGQPPDPKTYADLVNFAVATFKSRSNDFFMIFGGLDNAAPNDEVRYMNDSSYLSSIAQYAPQTFQNIDGFASHSYPNPGFLQPPSATAGEGVATYKFEYDFINSYSNGKKIPVFITETGWNSTQLGDNTVAQYFSSALTNIWSKDSDKIVAITPFLLESDGSPFDMFAFLRNNQPTAYYKTIVSYQKVKGQPDVNPAPTPTPTFAPVTQVLAAETTSQDSVSTEETPHIEASSNSLVNATAKLFLKTIFGYGSIW